MSIWDVIAMLILTWGLNQIFKGENPDRPRYWNMQDTLRQVQYRQQTEELRTLDIDSLITVQWEKR
jgi:hypothetical protein